MEEKKKQVRSLELRSEKARSIVGQIPSTLVRNGITAIGGVLLCFFDISCFLPYKHVLSGTATIHITSNKTAILTDSIDLIILLKFERKCTYNLNGQAICLQSPYCNFVGQIRNYSSVRDTLGRQNVLCRFKSTDIKNVENQTVDFRIVCSSENLLQKMLGR